MPALPSFSSKKALCDFPSVFAMSTRVASVLYCIYFDLLQSVRRDDLDASARLLREMDASMDAPPPSFYRRWGAVPESTASRYLTYLNIDPTTPINFKPLSAFGFYSIRRIADDAFGFLERVAPEVAAEIRALVTEIVFVSGVPNQSAHFDGATSFFSWGALFLNADTHRTLVKMIDGLSHESAHAYLFSLSLGDSFVENPDEELHSSPLRRDRRPLDGIFHATYVSARMHYTYSRVIESGVLSEREESEARKALAATCTAFSDGFKTLSDYASLTPLGCQVIDAAQSYMIEQADVPTDCDL